VAETTLLRQIQNEVAQADSDLGAVLRKCKILAARLKSAEFAQWISWELEGYPDGQPVPEYRKLAAQYYGNFMNSGWSANKQPFLWPALGKDVYEKLNPVEFRDGVAKVQALSAGGVVPRPELGLLVQGKMFPDLNCVGAWMEIGGNEFQQLLSAVRTRVLDFVLEIEAANPDAGEAPPDAQPVPAEKLQTIINNTFHAPVGNVAQSSQRVTQTAHLGIAVEDLTKFVAEFRAHVHELKLKTEDAKKVETQLQTIEAQLVDEPNPVIVREAGKTIRNITEQAIGGAIATAATQPGTWAWIQSILAQLGQ
jgi:hypothetical protein